MRSRLQCGHTRLQERCGHCLALQAQWYAKLGVDFEDAENVAVSGRPLKVWTGVSVAIDVLAVQEPLSAWQCAFPESPLTNKERLLHYSGFEELCGEVCGHGNHQLTPRVIKNIWEEHLAGGTNRSIAKQLGINHTSVWRTVNTLTQWVEIMDLDEPTEAEPLSKVVTRVFNPKKDEAFVYATWRNALWFDDENRREGDSDRFYRQATKAIRSALENREAKVRIACLSDDSNFIVGYSVVTGLHLHFVYVKADYRGKRIGTLLVPKSVETVSPVLTKIGRAIAIKKNFIKENHGEEESREHRD